MVDSGDENSSCDAYIVGGLEYRIYFDILGRYRHSKENSYAKENSQYTLSDLIDMSPFQINALNAWGIISRLEWKLLSESTLKPRDVKRKVDRIGQSILKKAFMMYMGVLSERFPGIDPLLAVQLIALGKNYYDIVLESPDYLGFIRTELQPIELHSILDIDYSKF